MSRRSRAGALSQVLACALTAAAGCGGSDGGAPPPGGGAVPRPDLTGAEAPVARLIEGAIEAVRRVPDDAEAWGRLGVALDAHGFLRDAVTCYERAGLLDPSEERWPYLAGYALSLDEPGTAIERFERAAARAPKNTVVLQMLGDALLRAGRDDEARQVYRRAVLLDERARRAMLGLAELSLRGDDLIGAEDLLRRAAALDFCDREVHSKLARLHGRRGRPEAAAREALLVRAYPELAPFDDPVHQMVTDAQVSSKAVSSRALRDAARGRYAQAEAGFRAVLALRPDDRPTRISLASALAYQGRTGEASAILNRLLDGSPDDPELHGNLATVLEMQGDPAAALEHLERALALDPGHAAARFNQGRLLASQGRLEEAIAAWREALRLDPVNVAAHNALASALAEAGRLDEAIGHWLDAIDFGCRDAQASLRLGVVMAQRGCFANAVEILDAALARAPSDTGLASALATILATCPDERIRDGRRAVTLARDLIERAGSRDVGSLNLLAAALAESGDFAGAIAACEQAFAEAHRAGQHQLAQAVAERLELYRRGRPYHQR